MQARKERTKWGELGMTMATTDCGASEATRVREKVAMRERRAQWERAWGVEAAGGDVKVRRAGAEVVRGRSRRVWGAGGV